MWIEQTKLKSLIILRVHGQKLVDIVTGIGLSLSSGYDYIVTSIGLSLSSGYDYIVTSIGLSLSSDYDYFHMVTGKKSEL